MSILNSLVQGKRAYLFADRAITDQDGVLRGTMSKFIKGAHFPWALSYSGHGALTGVDPYEIAAAIDRYGCETPRKLAAALPRVVEDMSANNSSLSIGLHVAAWSAKHSRPVLMFIANDDIHFPGLLPAYQLGECTYVIQGTGNVVDYLGREVNFEDPRSFDVLTDGVALMQAQRRLERFEIAYQTPAHRIGGGCEVAIVGRRGVRIETLWVWDDRLGERIDPSATPGFADASRAENFSGMTSRGVA
jgi:hypothetical protein